MSALIIIFIFYNTSHAKIQTGRPSEGVLANRWNITLSWFVVFFSNPKFCLLPETKPENRFLRCLIHMMSIPGYCIPTGINSLSHKQWRYLNCTCTFDTCFINQSINHMSCVIILDCPRLTAITPQNACQAGSTLTCSSNSHPDSSYVWIDNLNGGTRVMSGSSYTLPAGRYNLTCRASIDAQCTNGYYSPVTCPDGTTTEGFPFDYLLNRTNANTTLACSDTATVTGFAIRE